MNRQSSNSVKMLKMAASATKQTMKLSTSERSSVASIRLGNLNLLKPVRELRRVPAVGSSALAMRFFSSDPVSENGLRLVTNSSTLKPRMNMAASATKQTMKLSTSERSSVASIRLGNLKLLKPMRELRRVPAVGSSALAVRFFSSDPVSENGLRLVTNSRSEEHTSELQ